MERLNTIKSFINQLPESFISGFRFIHGTPEGPKEHEIERCRLWKNPEFHLNRILEHGLKSQGELYFLVERIRSYFPRVYLRSKEVADLVAAFEILLNLEITNMDQLIRHLATTFPNVKKIESPFRSGNEPSPRVCELFLRKKIEKTYQYLNENESVYPMCTREVANCLLYLSSSDEFSIPEPVLIDLHRLLRKWI